LWYDKNMNNLSESKYTIKSKFFLLDALQTEKAKASKEKKYVLTIHDLPEEDKPREKLISFGPGALSVRELLAVILNTGTRKEGIIEMTRRILNEYGEKNILFQTEPEKMAKDLNIPLIKALQIVAAGELGRRFFAKEQNGSPVIRTAKEVFEYVGDMRNLSKEHLRGIYLNTHYQVIRDEIISIGTVDANMIHPREIFRPAISCSAAGIILVHNHPSGILLPSEEDIQITGQIVKAGKMMAIELIDHIIVTENGFRSIPFNS
jgi:DNA repair protein RadC